MRATTTVPQGVGLRLGVGLTLGLGLKLGEALKLGVTLGDGVAVQAGVGLGLGVGLQATDGKTAMARISAWSALELKPMLSRPLVTVAPSSITKAVLAPTVA